jgi:hypothetical protein
MSDSDLTKRRIHRDSVQRTELEHASVAVQGAVFEIRVKEVDGRLVRCRDGELLKVSFHNGKWWLDDTGEVMTKTVTGGVFDYPDVLVERTKNSGLNHLSSYTESKAVERHIAFQEAGRIGVTEAKLLLEQIDPDGWDILTLVGPDYTVSDAARALGISRKTAYKRLERARGFVLMKVRMSRADAERVRQQKEQA